MIIRGSFVIARLCRLPPKGRKNNMLKEKETNYPKFRIIRF